MEWVGFLLIILLCLILEGLFSGSEIALVSSDKAKLRKLQESGSRGASMALKMFDKPEWFLSTTLSGTNLCVIVSTTLATYLLLNTFGNNGEIMALLIMPPFLLIFGEIIPKGIFLEKATRLAPVVVYFVWIASFLLYPVVLLMRKISQLSMWLIGARDMVNISVVTREELIALLDTADRESDLNSAEKDMIYRIFEFSETTVKEVMIPLVEVTAVEDVASPAEVVEIIKLKGYSRIPVYHERVDNLIGIIHSFDLLGLEPNKTSLEPLIRPAPYVPESKPVDELLLKLQKERQQMAMVVDEYGGTVGIVTIEDILEEIVGEIEDEHDIQQQMYRRISNKQILCNARMEIDQINELFKLQLVKEDFETLGGFLLKAFRRIPQVGESLDYKNLHMVIKKADERSIKEVLITIEDSGKTGKKKEEIA